MKNIRQIAMSLAVISMLSIGAVYALESQAAEPAQEQAAKLVEVGNKVCPVSGEEIKANSEMGEAITYEYNGKSYNLCCAMCKKDFKNNPEKYSKIADDEVANAAKM